MAKVTVGLKIGSTSLKFVEILHSKGRFKLKNMGVENFSFSEKKDGYVSNVSFVATKIKEIIRRYRLNPKRIVTGVEGESVVVRIIKVPYMKERELREAIRWEAQEHLPYPLDEITLGYHVLRRDLIGAQGREMSVLIAGVKRQTVDEYLGIFQEAGICPAIIDVNSLALYNVAENMGIAKEGVALLNIGHRVTNLLILSEGSPFLVRDIKFGGNDVTLFLMKSFNIGYVEAENLKKSYTLSPDNQEKIEQAIRGSMGEFLNEIIRSFEYYASNREGSVVQRIVISGGCSLLKEVEVALSQELEIPVERMNPFVKISYRQGDFGSFLPSLSCLFAVPVGLALREVSFYD